MIKLDQTQQLCYRERRPSCDWRTTIRWCFCCILGLFSGDEVNPPDLTLNAAARSAVLLNVCVQIYSVNIYKYIYIYEAETCVLS